MIEPAEKKLTPFLDWSAYKDAGLGDAYADIPKQGGDYAKAVAVCINSMTCLRPIDRGVMCPSFRITKDSAYSPGGRVRILKKLLNNDVVDFDDPELVSSLDACVACKGCKRECENNVDIAMIKTEFLAQRMILKPPTTRQQLFAQLPDLLHHHQLMKSLIKWRNRSPLLRQLGEKLFKISALRDLPQPAEQPFNSIGSANTTEHFSTELFSEARSEALTENSMESSQAVVLMVDSFTNHFSPDSAKAAVAVLKAAGYQVIIPSKKNQRVFNFGRNTFSGGFVEKSAAQAKELLDTITPWVEKELPIIGLEPSCLLMLRDEYKMMELGEIAEKAAGLAVLFEEFIAKESTAGRLKLPLKPYQYHFPLLVHGHCHQKAVGAMKSMRKVLKLIPDCDFDFIESSCCGGAGSFAYEKEHEAASIQMAELALLPRIRENPKSLIVSNGFSCREQIAFTADQPSVHLSEVLFDHLT